MIIDSISEAETALTVIGYYRLRGYFFHKYDRTINRYEPNTKFSDILRLYRFDTEISHLIFGFSTQIEVSLRARLVEALLIYNDSLILNNPSVFDDKQNYWKNQSSIASEIARSDDVFIKHNFSNHDGAIPIWAAVEVMSFGTLSKVIKTLKCGTDSAYAKLSAFYKYKTKNGNNATPSPNIHCSMSHIVYHKLTAM